MAVYRGMSAVMLFCISVQAVQPAATGAEPASVSRHAGSDSAVATISRPITEPLLAAGLSVAVPGAGLMYQKRFVRGGLFLLTDLGLAWYSLYWHNAVDRIRPSLSALNDSISAAGHRIVIDSSLGRTDTLAVATIFSMQRDSAQVEFKKCWAVYSQGMSWLAGVYLYNIMDAVDNTGFFRSASAKNPLLAGWLSAVPGLGLGQLYNGSVSKAGLIWMTQTSLALMAWNSHRTMSFCEQKIDRYRDTTTMEHLVALKKASVAYYWNQERSISFRDRNMYLWYSLFFYLYGVFDAVVDAHLHDYDHRMKLEPDLEPTAGSVGARLSLVY